jgi:peptide/nickel transport system substrate-binding protein
MKKSAPIVGFLLFVAASLAALPTHAEKTLRIGVQGIPLTQGNPYRNTGIPNIYTIGATFDGLTRIDANGKLQPWLATSWQNTGPLTWVLKLREGVKFSNGVPFNADAVVAVVEFFQTDVALPEMVARELNVITSGRAIDEHTVELTTARPAPYLPRSLPVFYVVEPGQWRRLGPGGFANQPIGTGPFKVDAYKPSKIEMSAFRASWRAPQVDRLEMLAIPDTASRAQAVQSGSIDLALSLGPEEVTEIERFGGRGNTRMGASTWSINFVDNPDSPFKDRRVRQAINYAVDRETITQVLLNGEAKPANQPAPPVCFGYNPDLTAIPYDPDEAKRLLAEAGYPSGLRFVVQATTNSTPSASTMLQVIAQYLAGIGVEMEIQVITVAELIRNVIEGGWEGEAFGLNYNHEPSVDVLRALNNHSCSWHHPWYCDERIMPAIEQAAVEFEPQRALTLRQDIMAFYRKQYASLFVYDFIYFAGMSDKVSGFQDVHGFINFQDIVLAE